MRYGERFTHRWKGWLCSALATAGLLAVSAGTATAQVTVKGPAGNKVTEGGTATFTVEVKGFAQPDAAAGTVTVTLATPTPDATPASTEGEASDISANFGLVYTASVPAGPASGAGVTGRAFSSSGTIQVQTLHDSDAEDEHFTLAFTADDVGGLTTTAAGGTAITLATGSPTALIIDDDENQTYTLALASGQTGANAPKEGSPVTVTLDAVPDLDDSTTSIQLQLGATLTIASLTNDGDETGGSTATDGIAVLSATDQTRTIIITPTGNDKNRVSDTITLSAYTGVAGRSTLQASLSITLADLHALPAVKAVVVDDMNKVLDPQPTSVEEGTSVKVAVQPVNKDGMAMAAGEQLKVTLTPTGTADAADYVLVGTFTIPSGMNLSNALELEARSDEDVGMETLMFDATVSGVAANGTETSMSTGVLSLDIMDATAKQIEPKAQDDAYPAIEDAIADGAGEDGLNPGEMVMIDTDDLFTVAMGYSASYGVSVSGDAASASASGAMITINALKAGRSEITVTGTATEAGSSFQASQTVSNVAEVKFPVDVVDEDLTLTWYVASGSDANAVQNLVEGQTYDIVVHANREITDEEDDVTVTFMRDRAASEAGDSDYTVETVTLTAGNDRAHGELAVMDDDVSEGGTDAGGNVGEQLVLFGEADPDVPVDPDPDRNNPEGALTLWDTAVPALPVIATWLLGLGLLGGGARQLYRRRRQG